MTVYPRSRTSLTASSLNTSVYLGGIGFPPGAWRRYTNPPSAHP